MLTFLLIIASELRKKSRNISEVLYPTLFFLICIVIFPIALGTEKFEENGVISAAVWVSAVLALCLSLENIFMRDYADGTIEMTILSGFNLPVYCLARAVSYWLSSGISIIFASIPVGFVLGLESNEAFVLFISLTLVTATISLLGTPISALTAGLRGGSLLLIILLLPLLLPPVIFGASATANIAIGLNPTPELFFLSGFFVLALSLSPTATALAIRIRNQ